MTYFSLVVLIHSVILSSNKNENYDDDAQKEIETTNYREKLV